MTQNTLLLVFVGVTSLAVVLQMLILAGMYISSRRMSQRVEALSNKVEEQVLPLVSSLRGLVNENGPKLQSAIDNISETTSLVRAQAGKIDEALTEIVGIARSQAVRADVLATRTMERVDIAAEAVQHTVLSPLRHVSALMEGLMAGVGQFMGGRKAGRSRGVPSDDMFI